MIEFAIEISAGNEALRGTVDELERRCATRALDVIRKALGEERMLELLEPLLAESDEQFREWAAASDGKFRESSITLDVTGLSLEEYRTWRAGLWEDDEALHAAHPEHFALSWVTPPVNGDPKTGVFMVCETLAGKPTCIHMRFKDISFAPIEPDPQYTVQLVGQASLRDGTDVIRAFHQFRNSNAGMTARMGCYFPAAVPDLVVVEHQEHFAIEFSNWLKMAARHHGLLPPQLSAAGDAAKPAERAA